MVKRLIRRQALRLRPRGGFVLPALLLVALTILPALALAGPRSGSSFGGRMFRNSGGMNTPRNYGTRVGGGGHSFFFLPSFGWGWGGMGYGGGFGSILVLAVLGIAAFSLVRVARRYRNSEGGGWGWNPDHDDDAGVAPGRAYVYRMQVALGRSARGIQDRLARFASEGDTSTEAGLANMLQQTALELMRERDSIRAAAIDANGPMTFTNAETNMNGLALAERSRFQVERVRGADGQVRRSEVAAEEGREALEFVVVTVIAATRTPLGKWKGITDRADLDVALGQLGGISATGLLGMEVVWTPADANDSMTETDLMTTYPDLRSV